MATTMEPKEGAKGCQGQVQRERYRCGKYTKAFPSCLRLWWIVLCLFGQGECVLGGDAEGYVARDSSQESASCPRSVQGTAQGRFSHFIDCRPEGDQSKAQAIEPIGASAWRTTTEGRSIRELQEGASGPLSQGAIQVRQGNHGDYPGIGRDPKYTGSPPERRCRGDYGGVYGSRRIRNVGQGNQRRQQEGPQTGWAQCSTHTRSCSGRGAPRDAGESEATCTTNARHASSDVVHGQCAQDAHGEHGTGSILPSQCGFITGFSYKAKETGIGTIFQVQSLRAVQQAQGDSQSFGVFGRHIMMRSCFRHVMQGDINGDDGQISPMGFTRYYVIAGSYYKSMTEKDVKYNLGINTLPVDMMGQGPGTQHRVHGCLAQHPNRSEDVMEWMDFVSPRMLQQWFHYMGILLMALSIVADMSS